jgi:hypothetical protein
LNSLTRKWYYFNNWKEALLNVQTNKSQAELLGTDPVLARLGLSGNLPILRDEFSMNATPSQNELLAAQSGFNATKFAYTAAAPENNDGVKNEEEKRAKENMKRQGMLNAFSTFDIGGIEMSMEQIVGNLGKISGEYDVRIQRNYEAARVTHKDMSIDPRTGKPFDTPEQRDEYYNNREVCPEGLTSSEITKDADGNLVSIGGLEWAEATEEAMTLEKLEVEALQKGLADGSILPETLTEDQQLMITNMETYGTTTPGFDLGRSLEMVPAEVLINAGMAPLNSVQAEVTYQEDLNFQALQPSAPAPM